MADGLNCPTTRVPKTEFQSRCPCRSQCPQNLLVKNTWVQIEATEIPAFNEDDLGEEADDDDIAPDDL